MNRYEQIVKRRFESTGWKVLNGGWPDFLCIKGGEVRLVEVKGPTDLMRPSQVELHRALHDAFGLSTYTYRFQFNSPVPIETFDGLTNPLEVRVSAKQLRQRFIKKAIHGQKAEATA